MTAGKVCNLCHKWQPIEQYSTFKQRGKVHMRGDCKTCCKARCLKRYYEKRNDPDYMQHRREQAKEVYKRTRAKRRATSDAWYQRNRDRVKANRKRRQMRKVGLLP